ncbi:Mitochondrial inner membrane magnesium transporter mrs2 [Rhizoctonia solani]|uniref:Magnesium transporter n=1 Tax=Rhizoctonia solani TaxID=456999 RepID=A0A0K6GA50_9AGAM|nr:Mitochondrial inner membrane magnesium transporter mrs2 [Rhizoctonia solani]
MLAAISTRCRLIRRATHLGPLVSVETRVRASSAEGSSHRQFNSWQRGFLSDGDDEAARAAILENALKGRQPTDLMLRCTILDAQGTVKSVSGQFTKSDLCAEHRLNPRDLRKIDSRIPNLVPTILTRKEAILVNILHIRALVKADAVILFDSYGSVDSRLHSVFLYHLEHNLKQKSTSLPYEFRALESILVSVVSALEAEMVFTRHLVGGLLAELEDDIDRDKFKRLLHYSRRLQSFMNRAKLVQTALEEVLQQDEDMNSMYLTDQKLGVERKMEDHDELEVLLESFDKQVEEIVNEAETTISNVQSTQEIVELILDSNRNALLALDLKVSIGTFGIGVGALVAGLFGMNLQSHLEDDRFAFFAVSGVAAGVAGLVAWLGMRRLDKIRRVGLSSSVAPKSLTRTRPARKRGWLPSSLRGTNSDTLESRWAGKGYHTWTRSMGY